MFGLIEKRLILAALVLAWLGFLAYQVGSRLGGALPAPPNLTSFAPLTAQMNHARQVQDALSLAPFASLKPAKSTRNPFYPNPKQPPPPPPPPPSTRKIEVLYQGFFMNSQGEKRAYIQVADQLVTGPVGTKVVANLVVADIALRTLTLKDSAGRPTVLDFNVKKAIEIPVQ
jgi:hypothetical protein